MYTKKEGTNDSLFMISFAGTMKHNHSYVIFGEVMTGQDVIDSLPTVTKLAGTKPVRRIWIKRCGEYHNTPEQRERANTLGPAALALTSTVKL